MKKHIKSLLREALDSYTQEAEKKVAAGVLIKCASTNNIFLVLRNDKSPSWALVSGGVEPHEKPIEGLKREVFEELFIKPNVLNFKFVNVEHIPDKKMEFHYFEALTNSEFKPILDEENLNWGWFSKDNLPNPLYKGLSEKIAKI